MTKSLLSLLLFFSVAAYSQVPQSVNYQAVVRDASGNPVTAGTSVSVRFTIHDGGIQGTVVFTEVQHPVTNQFGLISLQMGTFSDLSHVPWGTGQKYLQVEIDPAGGSNFTDMGTSQLASVPYALFAANSANGPPGSTGPTGPQGDAGATGVSGPQGPTGSQGQAGPQGATGSQGVAGQTGPQGQQGVAGPQGQAGAAGPQGNAGVAGPTGAQGAAGSAGQQGIQGPTGANGATGATGLQGNTGPTGLQGTAGTAGAKGSTGLQGMTGATGLQGPTGNNGLQGVTGATGNDGAMGATGPQGSTGNDGIAGPTGPSGQDGAVGVTGPTGNDGAMGVAGPSGQDGTVGATGTTGNGIVTAYVANDTLYQVTSDGDTTSIGYVTGSPGAVGLQGPTGLTGDTGVAGPIGPTGNGIVTAYVANDTLYQVTSDGDTTSVGYVTGSAGAVGLQGPTGPTGDTGVAGPIGPTGAVGTTGNGIVTTYVANDTLYQVTTDGDTTSVGYVTGPAGATGLQGPTGLTGDTGVAGPIGPTGATGAANDSMWTLKGNYIYNTIQSDWVGIGTSTPSAMLEVNGNATFDGGTLSLNNNNYNTIVYSNVGVAAPTYNGTSPGEKIAFYPQEGPSDADYAMGVAPYQLWLSVPENNNDFSISFYGGTSEVMRVTGAGNVGIGTTSPQATLDLEGTFKYHNGTDVVGNVLTNDGSGNASWQPLPTISGPTGPMGDTGAIGPMGPAGAIGATGDTGVAGPIGPTGFLQNGSAQGNTPYWDGSQWQTGSSNIYNDGTNVGIANSLVIGGAVAPPGTALDINSTIGAFLPPRMSDTQRDAIPSPQTGMIIFDNTSNTLQQYLIGGVSFGGNQVGQSFGNPGTAEGQTFQVSSTSVLDSILVNINNVDITGDVYSMSIYNGMGGALLATASNTFSAPAAGYAEGYYNFTGANLTLTGGQTYYFEVTSQGATQFILYAAYNNSYPNGSMYVNGSPLANADVDFYMWTHTVTQWITLGAQGPAGPAGVAGAQGATGAAGPSGQDGAVGATGPSGQDGVVGATGPSGQDGAAGITGATGNDGAMGATGPQGATGTNGNDGAIGTTGPSGQNGSVGATGATGLSGQDGAVGVTGATGPSGQNGVVGVTGATGPSGQDGAAGAAGANCLTWNSGDEGTSGQFAINGPFYSAVSNIFINSTAANGANATNWINAITPGSTLQVTNVNDYTQFGIYTVTSNTAHTGYNTIGVTFISGNGYPTNSSAFCYTLNGVQGAMGATGSSGQNGAAGVTGATGAQGTTGTNGNNGVTGATGATGNNGATGATGPSGSIGAAGTNGNDGATGQNGATGITGVTGANGANCITWNWGDGGTAGQFGMNAGTYTGVTNIFINTTAANGANASNWLNAIMVGSTLQVTNLNDYTQFGIYTVTSNAESAGTQTIGVTSISGNGEFALSSLNPNSFCFTLNGATGVTGPSGQNGAIGATGPSGQDGATGAIGVTGPSGQDGATGVTGAAGATGATAPGDTLWTLTNNNISNTNTGNVNVISGGTVSMGDLNTTTNGTQMVVDGANTEIEIGDPYDNAGGTLVYVNTAVNAVGIGDVFDNHNNTLLTVDDGAKTITMPSGKVGIGTASPTATLHVAGTMRYVDGHQGVNKVLTSDSLGNATWQALPDSGGLWATSGGNLYPKNTGAYIGIGTATPTAKLEVDSSLKYVDGNQTDSYVLTSDGSGNANWKPSPELYSSTDRDAISDAYIGRMIFDTTTNKLQVYVQGADAQINSNKMGATESYIPSNTSAGQTFRVAQKMQLNTITTSLINTTGTQTQGFVISVYDDVNGNLLGTSYAAPVLNYFQNLYDWPFTFPSGTTLVPGHTYYFEITQGDGIPFDAFTNGSNGLTYPDGVMYIDGVPQNADMYFSIQGTVTQGWEDVGADGGGKIPMEYTSSQLDTIVMAPGQTAFNGTTGQLQVYVKGTNTQIGNSQPGACLINWPCPGTTIYETFTVQQAQTFDSISFLAWAGSGIQAFIYRIDPGNIITSYNLNIVQIFGRYGNIAVPNGLVNLTFQPGVTYAIAVQANDPFDNSFTVPVSCSKVYPNGNLFYCNNEDPNHDMIFTVSGKTTASWQAIQYAGAPDSTSAFTLIDSTVRPGMVLTSDSNGHGTWQNPDSLIVNEVPYDNYTMNVTTKNTVCDFQGYYLNNLYLNMPDPSTVLPGTVFTIFATNYLSFNTGFSYNLNVNNGIFAGDFTSGGNGTNNYEGNGGQYTIRLMSDGNSQWFVMP